MEEIRHVIEISTDSSSMILAAGEQVYQCYYGKKVATPSQIVDGYTEMVPAYSAFGEETLLSMMDGLNKMDGEMFVLDDGWFGNKYPRNDAVAGLGDWQVNRKKLPNGITALCETAEARNLKFGIWVEPEMVNPASELYENHPEWVIHQPNREKILCRNQLVLDLSNPEVQDFIYDSVAAILVDSPKIAYVKWDCNRSFTNIGSSYLKTDLKSEMYRKSTGLTPLLIQRDGVIVSF